MVQSVCSYRNEAKMKESIKSPTFSCLCFQIYPCSQSQKTDTSYQRRKVTKCSSLLSFFLHSPLLSSLSSSPPSFLPFLSLLPSFISCQLPSFPPSFALLYPFCLPFFLLFLPSTLLPYFLPSFYFLR